MGKISLGDLAFGGFLTLLLAAAIAFVTGLVMSVLFSSSLDETYSVILIAVPVVFLAGGIVLGIQGWKAGYPVVRAWAWGSFFILIVFIVPILLGVTLMDGTLSAYWAGVIVAEILLLMLGLFFAVSLAGFLNLRGVGVAQPRTFGSVPGQFGAYIYKSNQPAIYEGIRELNTTDEAPGSLYRQKQ